MHPPAKRAARVAGGGPGRRGGYTRSGRPQAARRLRVRSKIRGAASFFSWDCNFLQKCRSRGRLLPNPTPGGPTMAICFAGWPISIISADVSATLEFWSFRAPGEMGPGQNCPRKAHHPLLKAPMRVLCANRRQNGAAGPIFLHTARRVRPLFFLSKIAQKYDFWKNVF